MGNKNNIKMKFLEVVNTMFKKRLSMIICTVLLAITCIGLVACVNDDGGKGTQIPPTTARNGVPKKNCRRKGLPD